MTLIALILTMAQPVTATEIRDPMEEPQSVREIRSDITKRAPKNWVKHDLGRFTIAVPADMRYIQRQGYDSFCGEFSGAQISLDFAIGGHESSVEQFYQYGGRGELSRHMVAGRAVDIVRAGILKMHAFFHPEIAHGPRLNFAATVKSPEALQTVEKVLGTIRFTSGSRGK